MRTVAEFWQDKAKTQADLTKRYPEGALFVTSVHNRSTGSTTGTVSAVSLDNAARLITMGTHRESTEEEVAAHAKQETINARQAREAEVRAGRGDPVDKAATIELAIRKMMREDDETSKPGPVQPPVRTK